MSVDATQELTNNIKNLTDDEDAILNNQTKIV